MGWDLHDMPDQHGRTFVITGANTGIGLATATALATRGAKVILACRNRTKGEHACATIHKVAGNADVVVADLDLADLASVKKFADDLLENTTRIDGLINNAGLVTPELGRTADGFEMQFGTNVLGHFALTGHLLPALLSAPKARVVSLSSIMHWVGRLNFHNLNAEKRYNEKIAYGQSKFAALVFTNELQRRLSATGTPAIAVCAHPGIARTELGRHDKGLAAVAKMCGQSADRGALAVLMATTSPDVRGGDFVGPRRALLTVQGKPTVQRSSRRAKNSVSGSRLWKAAETLTGVRYL